MQVKFFFEYKEEYLPPRGKKPRERAVETSHTVEIPELTDKDAPTVAIELTTRKPIKAIPENEIPLYPKHVIDTDKGEDDQGNESLRINWCYYDSSFWVEQGLAPERFYNTGVLFSRLQSREDGLKAEYHSKDKIVSVNEVIKSSWPKGCSMPHAGSLGDSLESAKRKIERWAKDRILINNVLFVRAFTEPKLYYRYSEKHSRNEVFIFCKPPFGAATEDIRTFGVTERKQIEAIHRECFNNEPLYWFSQLKILDSAVFTFNRAEHLAKKEAERRKERFDWLKQFILDSTDDQKEAVALLKELLADFETVEDKVN